MFNEPRLVGAGRRGVDQRGDELSHVGSSGLKANTLLIAARRLFREWYAASLSRRQHRVAAWHFLQSTFLTWKRWILRGGLLAPSILDEEEGVFGDSDPSPLVRQERTKGLQKFLVQVQAQWHLDEGVTYVAPTRDPAMTSIMVLVEKGLRRRPTAVMERGEDARSSVGAYWHLSDFESIDSRLYDVLCECQRLETLQIEHVRRTGLYLGFNMEAEGCRLLGVPEELVTEWTDRVRFEVDAALEPYSKGPYANVYLDFETLLMACKEFNKLIDWQFPVLKVPFIESRTTVVSKDSPLEEGGRKNRTCVDLTDSGLNDACDIQEMDMPTLLTVIQKMGCGSWMAKQDLANMFYNWRVHPELVGLFGVRHPLTGQSFVFAVLPMGFRLSPPIACRNTTWFAELIEAEMRAQWTQQASVRPVLTEVPREATVTPGAPPGSTVYVDDYMGSAMGDGWIDELVKVGAFVFKTTGLVEKIVKREGPNQDMTLLGFLFDSVKQLLRIPPLKAQELVFLLDCILTLVDA